MTEIVATFVTAKAALNKNFVTELAAKTGAARSGWLAEDTAVDLFYATGSVDEIQAQLRHAVTGEAIDVIVQPAARRRKRLLLADMESTLIEQEMLDELAAMAGIGTQVAAITRRAMNGELDFAAALRERVGLLKNLSIRLLEQAAAKITLTPGAVELAATMRQHGAHLLIVSGGFTCFTDHVLGLLPFHAAYANKLEIARGVIAGTVVEPILDKNSKKTLLEQTCAARGIDLAETLTVGDGANDIPMLAACNAGGGLGVAYHAKPIVRNVVPQQINHSDLKTLLYAQGYVL